MWERGRDHALVALDDLRQDVVQRTEDPTGLGVVGADELPDFLLMAASAVQRADDDGDQMIVVLEGVGVARLGCVALVAADVGAEVLAGSPLLIEGRVVILVALDSVPGFFTQLGDADGLGLDSSPASECEGKSSSDQSQLLVAHSRGLR